MLVNSEVQTFVIYAQIIGEDLDKAIDVFN
jgi:hypothetical protein